MSSVIFISLIVPLMIVATALIVDRIDRSIEDETSDEGHAQKDTKKEKDPPDDLIDLSGGMYGI